MRKPEPNLCVQPELGKFQHKLSSYTCYIHLHMPHPNCRKTIYVAPEKILEYVKTTHQILSKYLEHTDHTDLEHTNNTLYLPQKWLSGFFHTLYVLLKNFHGKYMYIFFIGVQFANI